VIFAESLRHCRQQTRTDNQNPSDCPVEDNMVLKERPHCGVDTERLQDPENLAADSVIGTQATERDAPIRAVVHKSLAPIAHVQPATAMATAQ
jgi:hypothetical protein